MADLEAVIASAIADSGDSVVGEETTETSSNESTETTTEETLTPEVEGELPVTDDIKDEKPPVVDEDPLAKELGLKPRADGKENRIPYSRVQKIIGNKVKEATTELTTQLATYTEKFTAQDAKLTKISEVEDIMFNDAPRFIGILKTIPGYAELLAGGSTAQHTTVAAGADDPEPKPDYDLGDGQFTYSPEGLRALRQWDARQTEKRIETRYKPIEDKFNAAEREAAVIPQINAIMEDAYKLEGFKENEDEILKVYLADKNLTPQTAYYKVMLPKLKTNKQKLREEILAELKAAPSSTSVTTIAAKPKVPAAGPRSLDDVIKDSLKGVKG